MTDATEIAEMIDPVTGELIDHRRLAEQLLEQAKEQGVSLVGPGGLLAGLTKTVLETALEAELTEHLGYEHGGTPGAAVEAASPAVVALDLVGDEHVGVQVRVVEPGVDMLEACGDEPAGGDLLAAAGADAGAHHLALDEVEGLGQRGMMRLDDGGTGGLVAQRPQHRGGLGHGEDQVEAGDRRAASPALGEGDAERLTIRRVAAIAEQPSHRLGRDEVAGLMSPARASGPLPYQRPGDMPEAA